MQAGVWTGGGGALQKKSKHPINPGSLQSSLAPPTPTHPEKLNDNREVQLSKQRHCLVFLTSVIQPPANQARQMPTVLASMAFTALHGLAPTHSPACVPIPPMPPTPHSATLCMGLPPHSHTATPLLIS